MIKFLTKKFPQLGNILFAIKRKVIRSKSFTTSEAYWNERYNKGGNSGAGSYDQLAIFKSELINDFVEINDIQSVIEFGCGDGNQLQYFNFPSYIGFDISNTIIAQCRHLFHDDESKLFFHNSQYNNQLADLTLSLDVLYHLIEDEVYEQYMKLLFSASKEFVIIYSCNFDGDEQFADHVKPRKFSTWVEINMPDFDLVECIPNKFPYKENKAETTSFADFYIYRKQ